MTDSIGIGEFFAEAFALCRECLGQVVIFVGVLSVAWLVFQFGIVDIELRFDLATWQFTSAFFGIAIGYVIVMKVMQCVLVVAMLNRRSENAEFSRSLLPYFGLTIVSGFGLLLGFLLLIVPGLILLTRWIAAPGYVLGRGAGVVDGMSKSWDLTSGKGWHIFAGVAVINGVSFLASAQLDAASVAASNPVAIGLSILSALITNSDTAISIAFGIAVFSLLDRSSNHTAEVFT